MFREYDGVEPIPVEKIKEQIPLLYPQPKPCTLPGTSAFCLENITIDPKQIIKLINKLWRFHINAKESV